MAWRLCRFWWGGLLCALSAGAWAHDPSAWGGVFRSRDLGGAWLSADAGQYIGGAMALAIHPMDPNHLLFATDTRLLRSRNGGRDWKHEAADQIIGPTTAVAFDALGEGALASSSAGVFYSEEGVMWLRSNAPAGAAVARMILPGLSRDQYFLAGSKGLYASQDHGKSFTRVGEGVLPDAAVSTLALTHVARPVLLAVVTGQLWRSENGGMQWQSQSVGIHAARVEVIAAEPTPSNKLWAAAGDVIYRSTDAGRTWQSVGHALPQANTSIRGIAVSDDERTLVLATHRGALRSIDAGATWTQIEGSLPVHLEAGLVQRDPHDAQTLYVGFALTPYMEIYRRAEQGNNLLSQMDPVSLAGGLAFLLLIIIAGVVLAKKLSRGRT